MSDYKFIIIITLTFLFQIFLSDFLLINGVRPDFLLIIILYFSVRYGSFSSVIFGFFLGLLVDFISVGSYFGLTAFIYSITGYMVGFLNSNKQNWSPVYYHLFWVLTVLFVFFIYTFFRSHHLFDANLIQFMVTWIFTGIYTLGFASLAAFMTPLEYNAQD